MPTKVLLASHHASRRGSAISLAELGKRLPERGYEPVFLFSKQGPMAKELAAQGFPVHYVSRVGWFRLHTIRQIQKLIAAEGIAITHANSVVAFSKYVGLATRLSGIPLVWHVREPVEDKRMRRQRRWVRWLADRIVVLTHQQAAFFARPEKTERVFNGVDLKRFSRDLDQAAAKRALGYGAEDFLFIQIGSIEHNKGQQRSLLAFSEVFAAHPNCHLLFVGAATEPAEETALHALRQSSEQLAAAVRIGGESSDVRPILWAADCLLLPSLRESFPRTVMEAMACGVPVIASAAGAVEDMVDHETTGFMVPPGDIPALATAMRQIIGLGTNQRREMSRQCLLRAEQLFSLDRHTARIASIYDALLGKTTSLTTPAEQPNTEHGDR